MSATSIPIRSSITSLIKQHPVVSMYMIMFGLAWPVMIMEALRSMGMLAVPVPASLAVVTGWAPGLSAIIVSAVVSGRAGVSELLRRFLIWRLKLRWYFVGAFLMAVVILAGIGLHILLGGAIPAIPAADASLAEVALIFLLFVLLGFLINTEEIAWRGFALPRLQSRYGALAAALWIAVPEMLLHLPLFWNREIPFFQTVGPGWFSAFTAGAVIIYVYVFNRTRGSLLIVTLLHASQNAWANLLSDNTVRPFLFSTLLIWILALSLLILTRGSLGYEAAEPAR